MSTLAVNVAPIELIVRLTRIDPRLGGFVLRSLIQCLIMPVWPRVNETKTPMMYSWIREVTLAWKMTSSTPAAITVSAYPCTCSCTRPCDFSCLVWIKRTARVTRLTRLPNTIELWRL